MAAFVVVATPLYILFLYVLGEALAATAANSTLYWLGLYNGIHISSLKSWNRYAAAAAKDTNFLISTRVRIH